MHYHEHPIYIYSNFKDDDDDDKKKNKDDDDGDTMMIIPDLDDNDKDEELQTGIHLSEYVSLSI
jgi:hypothetical protein